MSFGIQVRKDGDVTFELSSRLTTLILSRVVGHNSSGSVTLDIPGTMDFAVQAIPLDGDQYMRHIPHKLTYDASTQTLSWMPAISSGAEVSNLEDWASPRRSRSRIVVFGYMPEVS
ncbi:hypothetical protein [Chromohalobacter sp. 296-RDG]|uniref:hypothetical protein n=1 Tax=Chromohalobacter sp. 296-RDG TaxID=2994062 RepID=UPI0024696E49|nr:hypothetical protein [Chromohalobacter sp. 296-RDG]